ncbi:hypothetical protein FQN57_006237 [Myotisia sp. PD_48]|nr:hypothetical protein FQN57_006237 [Myotisia sp. PD_48]
MSSSASLPANVHVSRHPCLRVKLSQLRSDKITPRETSELVQEIATIISCEAFASSLDVSSSGTARTPLGYEYPVEAIATEKIALVPILRSGLGMIQAIQTMLPTMAPVHHLGLFREPTTLQPVEYYNNLPSNPAVSGENSSAAKLAILIDPVIATGSTAVAAIQTLKEWGVERIIFLAILGSETGLIRAASEWPEGVQIWAAGVDQQVDSKGMIKPGLGDIGDRLFLAIGK